MTKKIVCLGGITGHPNPQSGNRTPCMCKNMVNRIHRRLHHRGQELKCSGRREPRRHSLSQRQGPS